MLRVTSEVESSEVRPRRCRKLADLEFSSRWDGRGATERYEVREGHDLVCGLKRLLRHGSREAVHVAEKIRLEEDAQVHGHARCTVTQSGDPFYVGGRAWTDTQILPESRWPHLEKRTPYPHQISRSWLCLGPLTHLGRDPRSSQELGAGRKPEALRLPTPPSPPQPGPAFPCRARRDPSAITWSRPLKWDPSPPGPALSPTVTSRPAPCYRPARYKLSFR